MPRSPLYWTRLTKEGLKPDPRKVDAILKMEKLKDVAAVQRLIGLVKYLAKFLDSLSQMCEPMFVFGLEHNHYYTYGRRIILWTNHKPLVSIVTKPLASTPKRLQ